MNILITGGTGFIGEHLINRLKKNNKILVLTRKKKKTYRNVNFYKCNLGNPQEY